MGSFKLLLRLGLDSSSADPGYASKLIQVLVNRISLVELAQICLDFSATLFRLDAAFHGLLANLDQLADPIGMVLQIAGNAAEVGLDRLGRRSLQAEVGGNPLVDPRNLFEFAPDVVQMAVSLFNRRRVPRLDAVEPVSIGSRHYSPSSCVFPDACVLPVVCGFPSFAPSKACWNVWPMVCIPWGAMYSNFESRASSWSM